MNWPRCACSTSPIGSRTRKASTAFRRYNPLFCGRYRVRDVRADVTSTGTATMTRTFAHFLRSPDQPLPRLLWAGILALGLGGLTAGNARAQPQREPTTNPTTQERQDGDRDGQRGGWREPTPDQWEEAVAFLKEHNPRRLAIYDRAVDEWRKSQGQAVGPETELPRSIRGARSRIYTRVHFLRLLEERDPELYSFALRQFQLEDQIIGSLEDARAAEKAGDEAARERALAAADEAVRAYAEGTLTERKDRIERMRRELEREEERLEQDRTNFDSLVERLKERFKRSLPGGDGDRSRDGEGDREGDRSGSREGGRDD